MFRFQHIEYLIGLAAIPLLAGLFYLVLSWKKNTKKKIGNEKLVNELIQSYSSKNFLIKFVLATLALGLIIGGIANPQRPGEMENVNRKGVDIALAMDVSKSMLAEDIKP